MNDIIIVPMTAEHLDAVAALERQCFSDPWSRQSLSQELCVPAAVFLTASCGDTVAGYVGMHNVCGEGYITNIAVDRQYRRAGIAKALLNSLFDYATQNKMDFISLEVRESNAAAINLYIGTGFVPLGKRKGFYSHPTEDAVIMTKYFK